MLLAIDTSTHYASVALHDGERLLAEHTWLAGQAHTHSLLPTVERLLADGPGMDALSAIAIALGPGSFNVNVYNVFQQDVEIRGLIGDGYPYALNKYAPSGAYEPFTGAAASELFGLPPRTVEFSYTFHTR